MGSVGSGSVHQAPWSGLWERARFRRSPFRLLAAEIASSPIWAFLSAPERNRSPRPLILSEGSCGTVPIGSLVRRCSTRTTNGLAFRRTNSRRIITGCSGCNCSSPTQRSLRLPPIDRWHTCSSEHQGSTLLCHRSCSTSYRLLVSACSIRRRRPPTTTACGVRWPLISRMPCRRKRHLSNRKWDSTLGASSQP